MVIHSAVRLETAPAAALLAPSHLSVQAPMQCLHRSSRRARRSPPASLTLPLPVLLLLLLTACWAPRATLAAEASTTQDPSLTSVDASGGQQQQQQQSAGGTAGVAVRQECSDVPVSTSQLELAKRADIIVTGVVLAAGAGSGLCHDNGTLVPLPDSPSTKSSSGTSFVLVGLQCVHRGLVRCRTNTEDAGDCLLLLEAPVLADSVPCALTGGQRYMFF
ncbi:hypothetical protein Agub_g1110, partial [Astrephomene gubernaculifera]